MALLTNESETTDAPAGPSFRKLSILIPVYNERHTVDVLLSRVLAAPLPEGMERELVVVNDASTDGTDQVLQSMADRHPQIRLFRHEVNQGKGAAVRTAVEQATGDLFVVQDADLEYDPAEYPRLMEPILRHEADVVFGSRFLTTGYRRVLYFWHSVGNRFLTLLSNMCTNLNLTDMETCFKMAKAGLWKSIPIRSRRFGLEPEITAKFAKRGCRIYEVPISYRGRSYLEGKKITWKDGCSAIATILRFAIVDDIYNEQYGHSILFRLSQTHRFNRWMAEAIRPWVGENVLEIGAGMGNMTRQFLPRVSYRATDIDPLHLDYLSNVYRGNARVTVGRADVEKPEDFDALEGRFDTVICLNVVEHVEHDVQALRTIRRALRPGGRACILVPRGPGLYGTLDRVLGHFRRYTRPELESKLAEAGLEVEKVFTFNRVTVPGWWVNGRLMRRKHFGKIQLKLFDSLVWLWRRIDRLLPWRGISLIAIAKNPAGPASHEGS